jgi:hypothetical protein
VTGRHLFVESEEKELGEFNKEINCQTHFLLAMVLPKQRETGVELFLADWIRGRTAVDVKSSAETFGR